MKFANAFQLIHLSHHGDCLQRHIACDMVISDSVTYNANNMRFDEGHPARQTV